MTAMGRQLHLFEPTLLKEARLRAGSPRLAFYRLALFSNRGRYEIRKESGARDRVMDERIWQFDRYARAKKIFDRKIQEKTDLNRRSPRKYYFVSVDGDPKKKRMN